MSRTTHSRAIGEVVGMALQRFATIVLALLVIAGMTSPASAQEVRYRKHVDDMQPEEWKTLAAAIDAMRKRDDVSTKPTPLKQAADSYEWFVKMHGDATPPFGCEHGNELIWTWHRAFLLHFETVANDSRPPNSKPIRLPYWDWSDVPSGTNGFPAAYEDPASALYHDRNPHPTPAGQPKKAPLDALAPSPHETAKQLIARIVQMDDWQHFGGHAKGAPGTPGDLEQLIHNGIHSPYIGKDNKNTILSVRDPIFWAHHAMLDKVVSDWQAQHANEAQCFACDAPAYPDPRLGPLKVSALLSNDRLPTTNGQTVKIVYLPKGASEPASVAAGALVAAQMKVAQEAPKQASEVSRFRLRLSDGPASRYSVLLHGLSVLADDSYVIALYLYPAPVKFERSPEFAAKYVAGRVTQFGRGGHHHGDITARIDITAAVNTLTRGSVNQEWELALVFETAEPGQSYDQIAPMIRYSSVELRRTPLNPAETIELKKE